MGNDKICTFFVHMEWGFQHVGVTTLALGLRPKQGVARLRAKREAHESCCMLLGVQENVKE